MAAAAGSLLQELRDEAETVRDLELCRVERGKSVGVLRRWPDRAVERLRLEAFDLWIRRYERLLRGLAE